MHCTENTQVLGYSFPEKKTRAALRAKFSAEKRRCTLRALSARTHGMNRRKQGKVYIFLGIPLTFEWELKSGGTVFCSKSCPPPPHITPKEFVY